MTEESIKKLYFNWLCSKVKVSEKYSKLMTKLHRTEFIYILPMDANRENDGINLRYRFGDACNIDQRIIATYLDDKSSCSVFEMMVALCIRCEEEIMDNEDLGDRTGEWFYQMLLSLRLQGMDNARYNDEYVSNIINDFLNRRYRSNGDGGLFTIANPPVDMRKTEIWTQAMWHFDEIIFKKGEIEL